MMILAGAVKKNRVETKILAQDQSGFAKASLKAKKPSQMIAETPIYTPNAMLRVVKEYPEK